MRGKRVGLRHVCASDINELVMVVCCRRWILRGTSSIVAFAVFILDVVYGWRRLFSGAWLPSRP